MGGNLREFEMRIMVLGGSGKTECISVQVLANDDRVDEVVIADVNMAQAKTVSARACHDFYKLIFSVDTSLFAKSIRITLF